jgi:hypothetical protein
MPRLSVIAGAAVRGGTTGTASATTYGVGQTGRVAGEGAEPGQHPFPLAVAGGTFGAFAALTYRAKLFEFVAAFVTNVFVNWHIYLTVNSLTFLTIAVNNGRKEARSRKPESTRG